jgi:TRAP-type C4-dicarboxylate transport system permease small subunit
MVGAYGFERIAVRSSWYQNVAHPVRRLAVWSAFLAGVALLACVALTVVDIVLRNFFSSGITGMIELTQLAVIWAAFLTIPLGFALDDHISVDLVVGLLRPRPRQYLRAIAALAGAVVMALYAWWGGEQALHQIVAGERTLTIGVPIFWYWLPLLYGTSLSAVCAFVACINLAFGTFKPENAGMNLEF